MHKVFLNGEVLYAEDGQFLSDVLIKNRKDVEHPCGGRGVCKKCLIRVNGKDELSCRYKVESDIVVEGQAGGNVFSLTGVDIQGEDTENMCFCLDIGTTTLALALVSLDSKTVVRVITGDNPQRVYGADVISRVQYCSKNGVKNLQNALTEKINFMIKELCPKKLAKMYVAANAAMLHMLSGEDCTSLGVAPYKAVFLGERVLDAAQIGIMGAEKVQLLPSVHTFAGADIVAGLNFIGCPKNGKFNLLVDLGTNAEIALYSESSVTCTSAAAGPCFEGGNISCGMSATDGAVFTYKKGCIKTIGAVEPKGLCGTGLVDVISCLISDKVIDETGYMDEDFEIYPHIFLMQEDVRQYQLAKSAVCSGIVTLLKTKNVDFGLIENVYISGGFSAKLNIDSAVKTGLLPKELAHKCINVNNSSLLGTVKYALESNNLNAVTKKAEYVDLSASSVFSRLFTENMMF